MKKLLIHISLCCVVTLFMTGCPEDEPYPTCVEGKHYKNETLLFKSVNLPFDATSLRDFDKSELDQYHNGAISAGSPIWSLTDIINQHSIYMDTYSRPYIKITQSVSACGITSQIFPVDYERVGTVSISKIPDLLNLTGILSTISIATARGSNGGRFIWTQKFNKNLNNIDLSLSKAVSSSTTRSGGGSGGGSGGSGGSGGTGGTGSTGGTGWKEDIFVRPASFMISSYTDSGVVLYAPVPNTTLEELIPTYIIFEDGTMFQPVHNPTLERPIYVGNDFDSDVIYDMPLQIVEP